VLHGRARRDCDAQTHAAHYRFSLDAQQQGGVHPNGLGLFLRGVADPWAADTASQDYDNDDEKVVACRQPGPASKITDFSIGIGQLSGEIITRVSAAALQRLTALRHLVLDVLVFMGLNACTGEQQESFDDCGLGGEGTFE